MCFSVSPVRSRGTRPCHGGYGQSRRARLVTAVHVAHVGVASSLGGPGTARSGSQDLRVSLGSTRISPSDPHCRKGGGLGRRDSTQGKQGGGRRRQGGGVGVGRGLKGCRGGDRGWRGGDGERRGLEAERRAGPRLVGCVGGRGPRVSAGGDWEGNAEKEGGVVQGGGRQRAAFALRHSAARDRGNGDTFQD